MSELSNDLNNILLEAHLSELFSAPVPGIHVPDKWGHFRTSSKTAQYYKAWRKVEHEYKKLQVAALEKLYPTKYDDAPKHSPAQRIAYCFFYHNYEGLQNAIDALIEEEVAEALEPYQARKPVRGRPKIKHAYNRSYTQTKSIFEDVNIEGVSL